MNKIGKALKFVWKNNKVWLLVSCITLVVIFTATMIATQNIFLRNTINTAMGGERRVLVSGDPSKYQYFSAEDKGFLYYESDLDYTGKNAKDAKTATLAEANKFNERIVEEGIVLLKNEGDALPLATSAGSKTKISVFGKNSVNLVYGGSGSGGGNAAGAKTIYESLEAANYEVNPTLKSFYENKNQSGSGRGKNPEMGSTPAGIAIGETQRSKYTDAVKASYANYSAAALIVISRIGGEGFDLPRTMKQSYDSNAAAVDGAGSVDDHYLQLDKNEKNMIEDVCAAGFGKVILVINCSTSMELGFLDDGSYGIDAALWIGSPGGQGVAALGRILNGEVNPSGRLVDTYARNFKNDPTWANFANNNKTDGNRYTLAGEGANAYFVEYEESIYIGYRYYETRGYDEADNYGNDEWYDENVVFPFGYGLSYTSFEWDIIDENAQLTANGEISVTVRVTNTGTERSGKDVVQLYYSAPYYDGEIEKPHVVLGAFEKTGEIMPGEYEDVTLTLKVSDMASYDYSDANHNGFTGYEVEDGRYTVYIAENANHAWRESTLSVSYRVPRTNSAGFKYEEDTVTGNTVENRFDDVSGHFRGTSPKASLLTRSGFDSSTPSTPTSGDRAVEGSFITSLNYVIDDEGKPWYVAEEDMPTQGWKPSGDEKAYQLYEMITWNKTTGEITIDYDDNECWDNILNQLTISEMAYMIGTGNFNTNYIGSIGKPKTIDPDGPVGFTNFMANSPYAPVYDTCFYAGECVVAATWNKLLAHDMGIMIGLEGLCGNAKGDGSPYSGWYAPAVNIHRSPFSGRNWEYYAEDGYLSGLMGANVVTGAKSKGVYTYVKHFAVNDQETNRDSNGLLTWLTEQTMREIYLKPFEIIVKVGRTTGMMSSFNRIGTVWAGGSYELLTEVLREEWGFRGMVISDYNLYDHMPADQMIRAGGDLNLTQNRQPTTASDALTATQVYAIRQATKNILYTVAGSNAMNGMGEGVVYRYAMPVWMILLILVNVALLVGFAVWGFFAIRHKLKKNKQNNANNK